jgi:hypothetical protein
MNSIIFCLSSAANHFLALKRGYASANFVSSFGRTTSGRFGILSHQVLVPSRTRFSYFQGDQSHPLLDFHKSLIPFCFVFFVGIIITTTTAAARQCCCCLAVAAAEPWRNWWFVMGVC